MTAMNCKLQEPVNLSDLTDNVKQTLDTMEELALQQAREHVSMSKMPW
jgi:hypothetical protein